MNKTLILAGVVAMLLPMPVSLAALRGACLKVIHHLPSPGDPDEPHIELAGPDLEPTD